MDLSGRGILVWELWYGRDWFAFWEDLEVIEGGNGDKGSADGIVI